MFPFLRKNPAESKAPAAEVKPAAQRSAGSTSQDADATATAASRSRLTFHTAMSVASVDPTAGLSNTWRAAQGGMVSTGTAVHIKGPLRTSITVKDLTRPRFDQAIVSAQYKYSPSTDLDATLDMGKQKYTLGMAWRGVLNDWPAVFKAKWTEGDNALVGDLQLSLDPQNKMSLKASPHAAREARWTWVPKAGTTVEPAFDFQQRSGSVSVVQVARGQVLSARYDAGKKQAVLAWAPATVKGCRVALTVPELGWGGGRKLVPSRPTISCQFEQGFDLV